jgi:3-oxoacyl-[acyl-carrier protein] reductase
MTVRTAIVTGAARGIGAAISERLAADGMQVAVLDLNERDCDAVVERINAAGGKALAVGADVSDPVAVELAVERVAKELGEPTVLVNNAGIIRDNLIFKMTVEDWDLVMNVHLRGAFNTVKATQGYMTKAKYGRIINMSSISALGNRGQANYSAAKAGLQGMTKALAIELGKFGVTANVVGPGFIETDMTKATAERMGVDYEDFKNAVASQTPVPRVGEPADIANAVSFFASEASSYVSGQVLYVAGGPKA